MRIFQLTDDNFIKARKYRKILLDFFDVCEDEEPEIFLPIESELIVSSDEETTFKSSTPINKTNNQRKKNTKNQKIKPKVLQKGKVKCKECGKTISSTSISSHKSLHKYKNLGRAYLCPLCPFTHTFKSHITIHLKRSHKIKNPNVKNIKPTFCIQPKNNSRQIERVKCDKCDRMIAKSHIRNHKKFHSYKKTKIKRKIIE